MKNVELRGNPFESEDNPTYGIRSLDCAEGATIMSPTGFRGRAAQAQ
jgi:hypothetical protein